jgi:hypothetical protein
MTDKIDHKYTRDPICPLCGHRVSDAWELSDEDEIDCECGATFECIRDIEITYSTELIVK